MPFDKIYWLDRFEGKAHGGYYIRSNIFESIKQFEQKHGMKVVGVKFTDGWNVEFVCEEKPSTNDIARKQSKGKAGVMDCGK